MRKKKDSTLEQCRAEWRESRKKRPLVKAAAHCRSHHRTEPAWLREAKDEFFLPKKTGRKTDLMSDDLIYERVEEYLQHGRTQEKAFDLTAKENSSTRYTVKNAWLRHKKRIAFDKLPISWGGEGWRIRDEFKKNDRNAKEWDAPSCLKPKRKNPTDAEIKDAARALKLALVSLRTKNK
jgi:hypothetical protein